MRPYCLAAAVVASLVGHGRADSSFSVPPGAGPDGNYRDNSIYKVGDVMNIQWNTDTKDNTDILIWQQYPSDPDAPDGKMSILQTDSKATKYDWTVSVDSFPSVKGAIKKGEAAVFYLMLYSTSAITDDKHDVLASSHYFNVTKADNDDEDVTSTSAAPSTTSAGPKTTGHYDSPKVTSAGPSTTPSDAADGSSADADSSKKLSTGATAGIAVGATIGGLALLGGLGFLAWRHRRKANTSSGVAAETGAAKWGGGGLPPPSYGASAHEVPAEDVHKQQPVTHEMPGDDQTSTTPAGGYWAPSAKLQQQEQGPSGLYEAP